MQDGRKPPSCGCPPSSIVHLRSFGICLCLALAGCASDYNVFPTHHEADSLAAVTAMTDGFTRATGPRFSPDGHWLFFQAVPPGETAFAVYGGRVRQAGAAIVGMETPIRLTPTGSRGICPVVSPDGVTLLLACTAGRAAGDADPTPPHMQLFRADNWEGAVAVADPVTGIDLARHALTDDPAYHAEPDISPDGRTVCFTSTRDGPRAVYAMRLDGTGLLRLTTGPGDASGASFSADGKHLVFRLDLPAAHRGQIAVADVRRDTDGSITGLSAPRVLTDPAELCLDPAWFPDGQHIVYVRRAGSAYQLYLMFADGTVKTRLTFDSTVNVSPRFSPDGSRLAWTSLRGDARTPQLFIADFHLPRGAD